MNLLDHMNNRVKTMNIADIALIKWSVFLTSIIIVKLFPQLLNVNYFVLIALTVACAIKPMYKFWIKK